MITNEIIISTIQTVTLIILSLIGFIFSKIIIKNNNIKKYIAILENLIVSAVKNVNATYVDELKKNNEFNKSNQIQAFNKAKKSVVSLLNKDAKKVLQLVYSDLDEYVDLKINSAVEDVKIEKGKNKDEK